PGERRKRSETKRPAAGAAGGLLSGARVDALGLGASGHWEHAKSVRRLAGDGADEHATDLAADLGQAAAPPDLVDAHGAAVDRELIDRDRLLDKDGAAHRQRRAAREDVRVVRDHPSDEGATSEEVR